MLKKNTIIDKPTPVQHRGYAQTEDGGVGGTGCCAFSFLSAPSKRQKQLLYFGSAQGTGGLRRFPVSFCHVGRPSGAVEGNSNRWKSKGVTKYKKIAHFGGIITDPTPFII